MAVTGAYAQRVIADGATAYWRLGETSGLVANSEVGSFPGTISGGVTLNQPGGVAGDPAMAFDGTTGKIVTAASVTIPLTCTIEAWAKANIDGPIFSSRMPGATGSTVYFGMSAGAAFVFSVATSNGVKALTDSLWHHIVAVFNAGTVTFYVDGVIDGTSSAQNRTTPSVGQISIGWDQPVNGFWNRPIDDVAIYPTALTAAQIAAHYALRFPPNPYRDKVISDGAVAYWRLGEPSGAVANSEVGSFPGTISGGVTLNQPGALAVDGDKAMAFNGSTGRITVPAGAYSGFGTGPLSLECWVYLNALGLTAGFIDCGKIIATNGIGAEVHVGPTNALVFSVGQGVANLSITSTTILVASQWYHVVGTYVASTGVLSIYINGVLDKTQTFGNQSWTINATNQLALGSSSAGSATAFLNGRLDDAAIYQTALTPTQIATHFSLGTITSPYARQVITDGASIFLRLDEPSGAVAKSLVGPDTGAITGGVTLNQPGVFADGRSMKFDGSTGKIVVPKAAYSAFGTGGATWECWVRFNTPPPGSVWFLDCGQASSSAAGVNHMSEGTSYYTKAAWGASNLQIAGGSFDLAWHHIVAVLARGATDRLTLYKDGVQIATAPMPSQGLNITAANALTLGTYVGNSGPANMLDGWLDEVALYPTALTPAQIAAHYAASQSAFATTRYASRYRWGYAS